MSEDVRSTPMNERILRRGEVEKMLGISRSYLYRLVAAGDFPRPIKLGGPYSRSVGWPESLVTGWIADRMQDAGHQHRAA
tara:strand:+ start:1357 stop:1596 length:240 start_codon:yes stop_codon:yes gene_type:complete